MGPNVLKIAVRSLHHTVLTSPCTILNKKLGGARKFVAQSFARYRFQLVAKSHNVFRDNVVFEIG